MDENVLKLKENIFRRAKIFIEDASLFVPFAAKLNNNNGVKDLMAYENFEESINGLELINILKNSISKEMQEGLVKAGAVAYDVLIDLENGDGILEKRDALCLEITEDGINWSDEYFPYMIIDNQCVWR